MTSWDRDKIKYEKFLYQLLDPEGYGHAVSAEVRDEVRDLLGMKKVETNIRKEENKSTRDYLNSFYEN